MGDNDQEDILIRVDELDRILAAREAEMREYVNGLLQALIEADRQTEIRVRTLELELESFRGKL